MALYETKMIQVENDPQVINRTNEAWGMWGWSVLSVQVTHTQNTREYQDWSQYGSSEVTVETTTINYATITYQRDKHMPHYVELAALEAEYAGVENTMEALYRDRYEPVPEAMEFDIGLKRIGLTVFLLYMWVIPGLVYIAYLFNQYKKYKSPENQEKICLRDEAIERNNMLYSQKRMDIQREKERIAAEAMLLMQAAA